VAITPGALFYPDGRGSENIRLAFSQVDESLIDEGVERLASLLA
jgi:DNA-binding transcriptional MocR family regulator